MKTLTLILALMAPLALSAGCGMEDDEGSSKKSSSSADAVEWDCVCNATCDFEELTVEGTGCGTESDAEEAIDDAIGECLSELGDSCDSLECGCECEPTAKSC